MNGDSVSVRVLRETPAERKQPLNTQMRPTMVSVNEGNVRNHETKNGFDVWMNGEPETDE
jgi:hypothetical protein